MGKYKGSTDKRFLFLRFYYIALLPMKIYRMQFYCIKNMQGNYPFVKRKWQQKIFVAYFVELLKLLGKSSCLIFVSCFVFEIFRPETVRQPAILDLISPHYDDVITGLDSIKLHLEQPGCNQVFLRRSKLK